MNKKDKTPQILLLLSVAFLILVVAGAFLYSVRVNYSYFPYLADHVITVFQGDKEHSQLSSDEYVLYDAQALEGAGKRVSIISQQNNQYKDLNKAVENSQSIYINLFNNLNPVTEFANIFDINSPFEIKAFLSKDSSLKMVYDQSSQTLNFILPGEELLINNQSIRLNDFLVFSHPDVEVDSFLKVGDLIIDLSIYNNDISVLLNDIDQKGITKYKLVDDNLLDSQNFGFEQGLWDSQVADCSAYLEGEPDMSSKLTGDSTQGRWALNLDSRNHFACTLKDFDVELDSKNLYKLSFDYKNITGDQIQYYYNIKNEANQIQEKFRSFSALDHNWNNHSAVILPEVPNPNKMGIYFYAPSDGSQRVNNNFDNLKLSTFEFDRKIDLRLDQVQGNVALSNWLKLESGLNNFAYIASDNNLLAGDNYSFEQGLWSNVASDCSDYLPGEGEFGIELVPDATDGDWALQISSANHFACLFQSFPAELDNSKVYKLSFDYKNLAGNKIQYFYNMANKYDQLQNGFDSFEQQSQDWQTHEVLIDPTITNPHNFDFYAYAPSDGSEVIVNLFDNLQLKELAPNGIYSYFLHVAQAGREVQTPQDMQLVSANRWDDILIITGMKDSAFLIYPRQYSEDWHAYTKSGEMIPETWHYQVDGSFNAWWLDIDSICGGGDCQANADGSYDIELEIINDSNKLLLVLPGLLGLLIIIFIGGAIYVWKQ